MAKWDRESQPKDRTDAVTPGSVAWLVNESRHAVWRDSLRHVRCDFFQRHRHIMWRDSSISRATRLGATKRATSWNFSWGGVSFKILD
jgi:hypothetical protein